jgi:hypothetical protein
MLEKYFFMQRIKTITLGIVFLLIFTNAFTQNKHSFIISSGLTLSNFKFSKLPYITYKLKPLQGIYFINNYIGVGLDFGFFYDKIGLTESKEYSTNVNIRGVLNNKSKFKPYIQISSGVGKYSLNYDLGTIDPNDPVFSTDYTQKGISKILAPSVGTYFYITKRFGIDLNLEYHLVKVNLRNVNIFNLKTFKNNEMRLNCALFYKFNKKKD